MTADPALVAALTQSLFPSSLAVQARDPTVLYENGFAAEHEAIEGAVTRRVTEFYAGRAAAHAAMVELSQAPSAVPMGPDRAPVWPAAVVGSISHTATACVAVLGLRAQWAGIGVDLEEASALDPLLVGEICTRSEQRWLGAQPQEDRGVLAKLIFSAKEAAYKAQYALNGQSFGFDGMEIMVDRDAGRFKAYFLEDRGPFVAEQCLRGEFVYAAGLLVTGVLVGHSEVPGRIWK